MKFFHNHSDEDGCCSHEHKHSHDYDESDCCSHEGKHSHVHEHGGCSCGCETAGEISFDEQRTNKQDKSFFIRHKEFFVIFARIIVTLLAFFAVAGFLQSVGKEASGLVHEHGYTSIGTDFINLGSLHFPVVLFYFIPYIIICYDILWRLIRNITRGKVFDEKFLMAIATIGALALGEYAEAIAVMIFYQTGEMFQDLAVRKSKKSISDLMDIRPDYANIDKDGVLTQVDPKAIEIGQIIIVKPGEKIPLDGVLIEGDSSLDTSALTGEVFPKTVALGDEVLSGCVNITGVLRIKVTKVFGESTVSKILHMVENASSKKPKVEKFITRFARYYTPIVVVFAALLATVPPLVLGGEWIESIQRALILLVISCPCALVISVPLGFFAGIGAASKNGILVKGGNYLEALAKLKTAVFDKTGTLTRGIFTVTAVHVLPFDLDEPNIQKELELLELTSLAERYSNHPISRSIKNEWRERTGNNALDVQFESRVKDVKEIAGQGLQAIVDGKKISVGNARLMESLGLDAHECTVFGTIIHIAIDGDYVGHMVIADEVKPEAKQSIADLKSLGTKNIIMLTGDSKLTGEYIAKELSVDTVFTELLPQDKVSHVERLLAAKQTEKSGTITFVGDGINDAPVLALADIGIAMGGVGSDAAIEAADIVLMDDNPAKLPIAVKIARRTMGIIKQNIVIALSIKTIVMILGGFGFANMWMAIFADTGVALFAVLNSMRASKN